MTTHAYNISLREITSDTVRAVTSLSDSESQIKFVAPNAISLAEALFSSKAWYRAIYNHEELVGFVMLADESLEVPPPKTPSISVWRFMVDARFQRQDIGRLALLKIIDHVRRKGIFMALELSYIPGPGCPEEFYLKLGFQHTGRSKNKELILGLPLH